MSLTWRSSAIDALAKVPMLLSTVLEHNGPRSRAPWWGLGGFLFIAADLYPSTVRWKGLRVTPSQLKVGSQLTPGAQALSRYFDKEDTTSRTP